MSCGRHAPFFAFLGFVVLCQWFCLHSELVLHLKNVGHTHQEAVTGDYDLSDIVPFDWSDVNLNQKANCGMAKCFLEANSNGSTYNDTLQVGYLVASRQHYRDMRRASELANWLTREFGAHHFYMEDAQMVRVTPELVDKLNELVHQPLRIIANKSTQAIFNENETVVALQKVIKAPTPTLTFGSSATKVESLQKLLPEFRQHIPNKTALAEQLYKERSVIHQALVTVSTLWRDFQGMVDVHGNFYFIDLDGHFSKKVVTEKRRRHLIKNRMNRFDDFIAQLLITNDTSAE